VLTIPGFGKQRQIAAFPVGYEHGVTRSEKEELPPCIDSPGSSLSPDGQILDDRPEGLLPAELDAADGSRCQRGFDPERIVLKVRASTRVLNQQQSQELINVVNGVESFLAAIRIKGEQIGRCVAVRSFAVGL
jgi:hypothetical protein